MIDDENKDIDTIKNPDDLAAAFEGDIVDDLLDELVLDPPFVDEDDPTPDVAFNSNPENYW